MTDYLNKKVNFIHAKICIKITRLIFSKGSSKIFSCNDVNNTSSNYCIKIVQARADDKLLCNSINSEILILGTPNIVELIDYHSEEKSNFVTFFILLEYCAGNLLEMMQRLSNEKNTFSDMQIFKIVFQIASGLKSLHANKYAHRDIRPDNILVTYDGNFKICDFGSASRQFYDTINSNTRIEIIFDISRNTLSQYRAPEQNDLHSGNPINEKVDVWGLGIILYRLIFGDSKIYHNNGNILLTDEMISMTNSNLIELLRNVMKSNPNDRYSTTDILNYIEKNASNQERISRRRSHNYNLKLSDAATKLIKLNSTKHWIDKLIKDSIDTYPKLKYLKQLVNKAWTKKAKIIKFYTYLSARPIHFVSCTALKMVYVLHYYIFYGPNDTIYQNGFNLEEFLSYFGNLWSSRCNNEIYDKDDLLKNAQIAKFIVSYNDLIKVKLAYNKKYNFMDNNYSIENLKNNFDFSLLVEKKFMCDTLSLYSLVYQKLIQIPLSTGNMSNTLDIIIQILNEELISLFNLIFYLLVAYKNNNAGERNEKLLKLFDSQFFEITFKAKENLEKIKKFRNDIKSQNKLYSFPSNYVEYFTNLDNSLKFFVNDFNIKNFFCNTKDINGIRLNRNIGNLLNSNKTTSCRSKEQQQHKTNSLLISSNKNSNSSGLTSNLNQFIEITPIKVQKGFEFSDDKFIHSKSSFDFSNSIPKRASTPDMRRNQVKTMNSNSQINNYYESQVNKIIVDGNTNIGSSLFNHNFFSNNKDSFTSVSNSNNNINTQPNEKDIDILNRIFDTNDKLSYDVTKEKEAYNTNKVKALLNEIDNTFNNYKPTPNVNQAVNINMNINTNIVRDSYNSLLPNKSFNLTSTNTNNNNNPYQINYNNNYLGQNIGVIPGQQVHDNNINMPQKKQSIDKQDNYNEVFQNNENISEEELFESANTYNNPNINIITIQNHYNNYGTENKKIENMANSFLLKELSKGNLHWLISSRDIEWGKQIGFGGSSEVYIADYRGTEVAVKKLRILEVKEEKLKEFKREVSSLVMLRHPNLVLFMGAIAEKDNICIITEYCAGGTLFNILHMRKELIITWELRLRILLEIAIGMNFLHTNQPPIIHRDLKSLNILLTEKIERPTDNTKIKISDFGLSKIIKQFDPEGEIQMTGQLGTCHWMAPEVIENKQYTLKADVFSYGIIIWEICTRKTPYADMTQQQISFYVTVKKGRPDKSIIPQNAPTAVITLLNQLVKLMESCWDPEPNNRPSFSEIIDYLKKIKL